MHLSLLRALAFGGLFALGAPALAQNSQASGQDDPAISREQAEQIAIEQTPGRVEEADLESWDGRMVWEVEVEAEGDRDYDVVLDAETGEIIETDD